MGRAGSSRAKIIKTLVDRTAPPAEGSTIVWDTLIPGFGLRVRASGSKSYVYKYRIGVRQRWLDLGRHGVELTTEEARAKALTHLR